MKGLFRQISWTGHMASSFFVLLIFVLVLPEPADGGIWKRGARSQASLILRLRGGSSHYAEKIRFGPLFNDVLRSEGAMELFNQEEIDKMRNKFLQGSNEIIPLPQLPELRRHISRRRDKLSRALMTGGDMSESVEAKVEEPISIADLLKGKHATKASSTGNKTPNQEDGFRSKRPNVGHGEVTEFPLIPRQPAASRKKAKVEERIPEHKPKAAQIADANAGKGVIELERDMLHYNPSLREVAAQDAASMRNDTYLGWSQSRLSSHAGSAGRCELLAAGDNVRLLSAAGVELGDLPSKTKECLSKLFRHLAPPVTIECSLTSTGTLEMLFYGPRTSLDALESVLVRYKMPYKPPSDEQPITSGVTVDREKEEIQLAAVIAGGGTMDDLLEDQSMHEDMAELMGPPSVKTALLQHQRKALHWMVQRELPGKPLFWEEHVNHFSGKRGWINSITRTFSLQPPKMALGGMLADEMGLGKTLTVIALIMRGLEAARAASQQVGIKSKDEGSTCGTTLIVCPLSVLYTWAEQLSLHTDGSARVLLYHGPARPRHSIALRSNEIVLTTYSVLASEFLPQKNQIEDAAASPLHTVKWQRIVLDEAHVISNRHTLQSRAVLALRATSRWVVTGTPIQNKIEDVFPMLAFLRVHPLEDYHWFTRLVLKPLREKDPASLARLRKVLKVFCLRRTKDMSMHGRPLLTLTPKEISLRHLRLSDREQEIYDQLYVRGREACYSYVRRGGKQAGADKEQTGVFGFTQVLVVLLRLRQVCDHPYLIAGSAEGTYLLGKGAETARRRQSSVWLLGEGDAPKQQLQFATRDELLGMLVECCQSHLSGGKRGPGARDIILTARMVWSVLESICPGITVTQVLTLVRPALATRVPLEDDEPPADEFWEGEVELDSLVETMAESEVFEYVTSKVDLQANGKLSTDRDLRDPLFESTKVHAVLEELRAIMEREGNEKAVVFSQFTTFLDVLCLALDSEDITYVRLDGSMQRQERVIAIERFHSDARTRVFLVSLKSGGMGLNLVAANNVLLADLWWNAAAEDQAMDRVHRVGQKRDVRVVRFVTKRTVEERILELQNKKRAMIKGAMHHKLTMEDVQQLFAAF